MSRGSRNSRGTTIRKGTGEKNWYVLAAYVAFSILGIAFIGWSTYQAGAMGGVVSFTVVVIGLAIFALVTYPALFKDSAYLRGTTAGWDPKWWFYIGAPILAAILAYVAGEALGIETGGTEVSGGVFALLILPVATTVSNAYYLYQRHRYVGVP